MSSDIKTVSLTLSVPLRFLGRENKAIEKKLDGLVSRYVPEIDGVLIKWSDLNILNDKGILLEDQPFVFWKITFTAHVFKPIENKLVRGKVDRVQKCYFIVKAMDSFSVTVSIPEKLIENKVIKDLMVGQDVYLRIKGYSEGVYRGELDEECVELIAGLNKQELEREEQRDEFDYAWNFEY